MNRQLKSPQHSFEFMSNMEEQKRNLTLSERFIVPPFSVLDVKQGYWQTRKRQWLDLGIQSEVGRGNDITWGITADGIDTHGSGKAYTEQGKEKMGIDSGKGRPDNLLFSSEKIASGTLNYYREKEKASKQSANGLLFKTQDRLNEIMKQKPTQVPGALGKGKGFMSIHPYDDYIPNDGSVSLKGTSIFDPVLCELAYRWFCPVGTIKYKCKECGKITELKQYAST